VIEPAEVGNLLQPLPDAPDRDYWNRQRAIARLQRAADERRN